MTYLHRLNESDFMDEGCPTVKRHPRSLSEAFPDERAPAIEKPAQSGYSLSWWLALLIVSALGAIAIVFGGQTA